MLVYFHDHVSIRSRDRSIPGDCNGSQRIYAFPNGYGASVVSHMYSYGGKEGLYELAVIRDGEIVYNTPITNDVIGWLTAEEVDEILGRIKNLSYTDRRTRLWSAMAQR